mmetsp:Transcript_32012/g.52892  ORF Transcript_32012/g.52892 Transcript_32012/m.52892 type:complete len:512 (+) Transcript_32012:14-1549(+)|eukprot:CAMPEP_0119013074 /NCGR_PEP_ID=MMETSP1176-20130426/7880_1 /TAXON_ID=265551 /ORGANISM="Synedropsis recta cf, Strain CCMP1620" /LENGTH=511 /DNA_ID=CAMNT_0006966125 /DNA_START=14 /DNA_END=1549 /DNA_ORIENTATION=+
MAPSINNPFKGGQQHFLLRYKGVFLTLAVVVLIGIVVTNGNSNNQEEQVPARLMHAAEAAIARNRGASSLRKHKQQEEQPVQEEEDEEIKTEINDDDETDDESFPRLTLEEYPKWLKKYSRKLQWASRENKFEQRLTKDTLMESFHLGRTNLGANQKKDGSFNYQYDFVSGEMDEEDSQVRQAGAFWGVVLCYQFEQTQESKNTVEKGVEFFMKHAVDGPIDDTILIHYPGESRSDTGTNALVALGLIDYLRTINDNSIDIDSSHKQMLETKLRKLINFLKWVQKDNQHFASSFQIDNNLPTKGFSSYYDGEAMLALVKAAKYLKKYKDLVPLIEDASMVLAKAYTVDVWRSDEHDSDQTKGFYQWSSMFLYEYYDGTGWKDANVFGDYVLVLSHWIINTHGVLHRQKNTGYAFEGIISAYHVAQQRNNDKATEALAYAIDRGLYKLTSWQVGGPLQDENPFLVEHGTTEEIAVGGVMNARNEAPLRIDTTQHQMHAVVMAIESSLYDDTR